jgi:hypothetical protein
MIGAGELAPRTEHLPAATHWRVAAATTTIGCLSLWDFYIGEIRIFDFAALAFAFLFLSLASVTRVDVPEVDRRSVAAVFGIFVLILAYSLVGIHSHPDNLKPSLGMLLGTAVFMLTRCVKIDERLIDRSISIVAWLHVGAFFLQLSFFLLTKHLLNYHFVVGLQPRLQSSVFRAAGLFLEPAIYCFFSCSLFLLRRQRRLSFGLLDALLLFSMFLSLSLWGISVAILLLFIFRFRFALAVSAIAAVAAFYVFKEYDLSHSPIYHFFENRLSSLGSDQSALGRYGGTIGWIGGLLSDRAILFGNGINNFFEEHGSNGWAFIVNSMGLTGTSLLLILFAFLTPPRRWLLFGLSMAILLTAAPLWKIFYFWFWIALMLCPVSSLTQRPAHLVRD